MRRGFTLGLLCLTTCGGGGGAPGPAKLAADPAVEVGCRPGPLAAGHTRAKLLACDGERIPGRLAAGHVGDFLLENARVRVVIRGPGEGYYLLGTSGGGIVDAAPVGGEDLMKELQPVVNLHVGAYDELVITRAGGTGPAEIVVRGRGVKLPILEALLGARPFDAVIEQRYRLAPDDDAVQLTTRIWPASGAPAPAGQLMDAFFLGGRIRPFIPAVGFTDSGASGGDFLVSDGTTSSYGLVYPRAEQASLRFLDAGSIRLAIGPTLAPGVAHTRWLLIGDGSVASLAERAWRVRGDPTGTVTGHSAPGVNVVAAAAGAPISSARTGADGNFRLTLPAGAYQLHAEHDGRARGADVAVSVAAGQAASAEVPAGATGEVRVTVRDPAGLPLPARVRIGGPGVDNVYFAGASGELGIPLPPGSYQLVVSRGMEYDAFRVNPLIVTADATTPVAATLTRVVNTSDWISLDSHLHSEMSTDSTIPLDDRLAAVAAEGVELAVSSDHDFVTDYAPVVSELGLEPWLRPMTGVESSSLVFGHVNAWPLTPDPSRAAAGALAWFGHSPKEIFQLLRGGDAARVVQVNHPRNNTGLYNAIDFDPVTRTARKSAASFGLADTNLADFGYDALEVANSMADDTFETTFNDWLTLGAGGRLITGTGSSDSHGPKRFAGNSRSYVYVGPGQDDPTRVDVAAVNAAIRARHVVVGQGVFVLAGLREPGTGDLSLPGDLVAMRGAAVATVHIRVQAPPWMSLARIRVYDGTRMAAEVPLDSSDTNVVRYDGELQLPLGGGDRAFVVRVNPIAGGTPVLDSPGPSFTNALLVNANGDGAFTPQP